MKSYERSALRAAMLIHEQQTSRQPAHSVVGLPEYYWEMVGRLRRQIALATRRGLHRAARHLGDELSHAFRRLKAELESVSPAFESFAVPMFLPTAADMFRDILALREEFDEVEIDVENHELRVTTDVIVLDDKDCLEDGLCPSCLEAESQNEDNHDDNDPDERAEGGAEEEEAAHEACHEGNDAAAHGEKPVAAAEPDRLGEALVPA
jgi:hypothetical protein